jgi:hypothetical protein
MVLQSGQAPPHKPLSAPTYYIAVKARTCEQDLVKFDGASNLPAGAVMGFRVSDFDEDAWKDYTDEVYVPVSEKGFFEGRIQPKKGMRFRRNLILVADFTTFRPQQLASVLLVVGKKGQNLGGINNPQLFQVSGWYYGLEAFDRTLGCGE